jgi:hypothetical protein
MRALAWALVASIALLTPGLATADSPTAYPTRVVTYQLGSAERAVGDPVGTATGLAGAAQQAVSSLDPGPLVDGAQQQAQQALGPALGDALGQLGPLGQDATDMAQSGAQAALDLATHAPDAAAGARDYANRVLRHNGL